MFEDMFYPLLSLIISLIALGCVYFFSVRALREDVASIKEKIAENDRNENEAEKVVENDQNEAEIEWLKSLKAGLAERVRGVSERAITEEHRRELKQRVAYLRRFLAALAEIESAMSSEDRISFDGYVDREIEKPLKQMRDLLTLCEMQNASTDPVLLLKGALLGEEVFSASSIASLLRRTRPGQMIRYFLPEIDKRVTEHGQENAQRVFDGMAGLGGDEVELIGACPGDEYDTSRYQIVGQDTSGAQSRDRIVRCVAHGLKNAQSGKIERKAKVIIAG